MGKARPTQMRGGMECPSVTSSAACGSVGKIFLGCLHFSFPRSSFNAIQMDDLHNKGWFSCNSPGVCQDVGSETGRKPPHDASLWILEYVSSSLLCDDRAEGRPVRCLDRGRFAEVPGSGAKTFDATRTPTGDWGWASV